MPTYIDLVVGVVVAAAALGGWRRGLTVLLPRLVGLVAGATIGFAVARAVVSPTATALVQLLLELGLVLGSALVVSALGGALGERLSRGAPRLRLRPLDRVAGAVLRGTLGLGLVWLLASLTGLIGRSAVLTAVSASVPPAAKVVQDVTGAVGVPSNLVALLPWQGTGAPSAAVVRATSAAAGAAVVKVEGVGCGTGVEGSAFVTPTGLIVSNAHVVAGTRALTVADANGTHTATVVLVDTANDLAVLRADGVDAPGLALSVGDVPNGTQAVVLGYPGDGKLTATSAIVVQRVPLNPELYRLRAVVRAGNSGGPLVSTEGTVLGVVNARSTSVADTSFALTLAALPSDLAAAATLTAPASTGACTEGALP